VLEAADEPGPVVVAIGGDIRPPWPDDASTPRAPAIASGSASAVDESPIEASESVTSENASSPQGEEEDCSLEEAGATPAEFLDLQEMFQQAETEKGNEMTVEDLKARFRTKYTEEEVNSWFQSGRFDDASNLQYTEFLATVIKNRRTIEVRRIREAFRAIDKGKRGFVTVGNLRAVLGSNNNENIEMLIKAADSKRDGRITYINFADVVKQWAGEDFTE
jgi:Ca2+-binding EF-hand superfamily protein